MVQGTTIRVPYDKQVPGLPAQPGADGGSKNWICGDNVKALQGG